MPLGGTGTSTLVTSPSVTVISTCTGPQRVKAVSPVYVFVPDAAPDEELDEDEDEGVGSAGAVAGEVVDGVAGTLEASVTALAGVLVEVW